MKALRMLLDVNVLLALAWPNHQFHASAKRHFVSFRDAGWSTCAITELGFIRISSNKAFSEYARPPAAAAKLLCALKRVGTHSYLQTLPSPAANQELFQPLVGHKQTTDAYLVEVAALNDTQLATFDRRLSKHPTLTDAIRLLPV